MSWLKKINDKIFIKVAAPRCEISNQILNELNTSKGIFGNQII